MAAKKKSTDNATKPTVRRIAGRGASARASSSAKKKSTRAKAATKSASRRRVAEPEPEENGNGTGGGGTLVIVESPRKAKTLTKYLGRGYRVKATVGHVRDLPEKKLGIDVDKGFEPEYVTIAGKEKTLQEIKDAAHNADEIYIATDPDREGEAIGWHVAEQIKRKAGPKVRRVLFHEYTKDAVREAMEHPRDIDSRLVDAQQARRVLDRLVGYKASPILWKTVKKGLSAGRVQTVALRLLVEREREIRAFKPQEYWSIAAAMEKDGQRFTARLHAVDDKKVEIHDETQARAIVSDVERLARATAKAAGLRASFAFPLTEVKRRERRKNPAAPFTTSTLQQEAAKKLGYGSKRIMRIAQSLYEGADLGDEGAAGLITYMRTDSTRVAESAAVAARDIVSREYGKEYLANGVQLYGNTKQQAANTQDAHEAIRPSDPARKPEEVKRFLKDEQFKLYQLIWQRFMASQMAPAVFDTTTLDFLLGGDQDGETSIHRYLFRATGSIVKFPGFLALYRESREEGEGKALEDEQALPVSEKGERVAMTEVIPAQHFTEPPPRFSEASLVKELEKLGIGRPSTYAQIISTLQDRHYVNLEQRRFFPTELGESVERVMVKQFPDVFNVGFTSEMEGELDRIEDGKLGWQRVLKDFWKPFESALNDVRVESLIAEAHDLSALETE